MAKAGRLLIWQATFRQEFQKTRYQDAAREEFWEWCQGEFSGLRIEEARIAVIAGVAAVTAIRVPLAEQIREMVEDSLYEYRLSIKE